MDANFIETFFTIFKYINSNKNDHLEEVISSVFIFISTC